VAAVQPTCWDLRLGCGFEGEQKEEWLACSRKPLLNRRGQIEDVGKCEREGKKVAMKENLATWSDHVRH
jgi:hypothetical protein